MIEVHSDEIWNKFWAAKDAVLTTGDDRLHIEAKGDDPGIILPGASGATQYPKGLMIELEIESPTETTAQLFYLTNWQTKYTNLHSQIVPLAPGQNIIYFKVDHPRLVPPLRFDPGTAAGVYIVSCMGIKALP